MNDSFYARLDRLIRIVNIPLENKWTKWTSPEEYTIYKYWNRLGLLADNVIANIGNGQKIESNKIITNYFSSLDKYFSPVIYKDGHVADVGSGFGHITFWLLLSGAKKVYTIGDPQRIEFIRELYAAAVKQNLLKEDSIEFTPQFVRVGHTTLSQRISPGTLSLVLLNDTLEHITPRILPYLIQSSFANLKEQGYFISRQQNTDSPRMFSRLLDIWEKTEKENFFNQRLGKINQEIPSISATDAQKLASSTRGLDSYDFKAALENFKLHKIFPQHDLNIPPIDIDIDVPDEGNTSIKRIVSELSKAGFRNIKVYPAVLDSRLRSFFHPVVKKIPQLFLSMHLLDEVTVFQARKSK
jgi:SAM-dependent methyltransferase